MGRITYKEVREGNNIRIETYHEVVVHTFTMGDVEDPDLFAAQPLWEWQQTDKGKFIMDNAVEPPIYNKTVDHTMFGYKFAIKAKLTEKKLSEMYLRWGK